MILKYTSAFPARALFLSSNLVIRIGLDLVIGDLLCTNVAKLAKQTPRCCPDHPGKSSDGSLTTAGIYAVSIFKS